MKQRIFIYGILLVLTFSSCVVQPVQITKISNPDLKNVLTEPTIDFEIGLKNPNNFGVTFKRIELNLISGEKILVGLASERPLKISAKGEISVPIQLRPSVKDIAEIVSNGVSSLFNSKNNQKMELRGEILIRKFIFTKRIKLKEPIRF